MVGTRRLLVDLVACSVALVGWLMSSSTPTDVHVRRDRWED